MAWSVPGMVNPPAPSTPSALPPAPPSGPTNKWARIAQIASTKYQQANDFMQKYEIPNAKKDFGAEGKAILGVGKDIVSPITGLAKDVNKRVIQPVVNPQRSAVGGSNLIKLQSQFAQAVKQGKVSQPTQQLLTKVANPQAKIKAYQMVLGGSSDKEVQAFLSKQQKTQTDTIKRVSGEGAGTVALLSDIGPLAKLEGEVAKQGLKQGAKTLLKGAIKEAPLGAVGGAGGQLQVNPESTAKELASAAATGAGTSGVLHVGGKATSKLAGKVLSKGGKDAEQAISDEVSKLAEKKSVEPNAADLHARLKTASSAAKIEAPTLEAKMSKPKAPVEHEPLVNTNKPVKSIVDKLMPKSLKGKLNPVDAAARSGHTDFSTAIREIAGNKIYALRQGNKVSDAFDKLYADYKVKGGTDQQFIKDIESGKLGSKAHQLFASINKKTGSDLAQHGIIKGARENYVGRVGQFSEKSYRKGGGGLTKSGSFSKARAQLADEFGFTSDAFKTHADYKNYVEQHGGKVLSNPQDILRHTLPSKLEAVENAKGLERLDKTAMADGRPAAVGFSPAKGVPRQYNDYNTTLIPGRAVHPDAVQSMKALVHTYTPSEINNPVAKVNSIAKQVITLNGLIHAKNFGLASLRKQGALHTAKAFLSYRKDLGKTFGEDNIKRAVTKGGLVPFEQAKQDLFDQLGNPKGVKTWNKLVSLPGKLKEGINEELFNKLGNHLSFSTYFNTEKQMLKAGLSADEAARVAGQAARNVSFISSPVETSVEYRKSARMILFAGQYFKSTLNEMGRAIGVSRDMSLSKAAQRQSQKNAIAGIARGATYLLALAQGVNYAATGHSTFQNKGSKISPVFYVDKNTGKEYHITNWYGQIGDMFNLLNNPIKELSNKVSPLAQEGSRLYQAITSGQPDPYTGQTIIDKSAPGWRQTSQAIGNFIENMVSPLGFQLSPGQRSNPAMVTFAKLLGYSASTMDQNAMEQDILNQYYATLPAGATKTSPQVSDLKQRAAFDLSRGMKDSPNLEQLKTQLTPKQYNAFLKTGGESPAQQAFDKLPEAQRLQIVEKYNTQQLKELDLTSVGKSLVDSSARQTIQGLQQKGFSNQRIQKDLQKAGLSGQLNKIKAEAKRQTAISSAKARHAPKFKNPFIR